MGWVYPICVITNWILSPWRICAKSYGPHSLRGKPDFLASKERQVKKRELGRDRGSSNYPREWFRSWKKRHREGTVPEDLGAGLVPTAFSSRGRGWKKVYTKSHWNRIRKQGHFSMTMAQKEKERDCSRLKDLWNITTKCLYLDYGLNKPTVKRIWVMRKKFWIWAMYWMI